MPFCLRCPECRDKFPWEPKVRWPRYCPLCRADINNDRDDSDIVTPFIRSRATKNNDQLYRQMEAGSEMRAKAAAEMAGCDVSEMSGLKITNMADRPDAEIAHIELPQSDVGRAMAMAPQSMGFAQSGLGYSGAVAEGIAPNSGARVQQVIRGLHPEMVGRHTVGINEHGRPVRPSAEGVITDTPAKEVLQPNYRRRV